MVELDYGCALGDVREQWERIENDLRRAHERLLEDKEAGVIGFLDLPFGNTKNVKELAKKKRSFTNELVLIGIGGSSLGAECAVCSLGKAQGFYVMDNVDPDKTVKVLKTIDPERTCFTVISKSGSTTETIANFMAVHPVIKSKEQLVIITDPERGFLRSYAQNNGIDTLPVPPNVPGRFSVLSPVGLFPMAYMGVDVDKVLEGAKKALELCMIEKLEDNPAWIITALHYLHLLNGKNIAVMMPYAERLSLFVSWWRQLWAESLGKEGKGQTPVKAIGTVDQHSQIQLYNDGPKDKIITLMVVEDMEDDIALAPLSEEFSHLA